MASNPATTTTLIAERNGDIVGVATCARSEKELDRAEVAFAVDDARHGLGIGTRLLEGLADWARHQDVRVFDAYVLGDNAEMLRVFQDSGFGVTQHSDAGVSHVVVALQPTGRAVAQTAARSQIAAAASMRGIFEPRSVVVVGANRERGKIGSEILHNLRAGGFKGQLFAVHPAASSIDDVPAYAAVSQIPGAIDLAVICVPAASVNSVADDCIAKGVKAIVVISAGFAEVGASGRALEIELVDKIRRAGIRLVGPNCMGLINTNPAVRMNATFAPVDPPAGHVGLSTQSGALGLAILDYARALNIGFSTFVSIGNKADVSGNDLLQYWETDPETRVILLYLESFGNPRKFTEIARRVARRKPIVAVKAGRSQAGARAASSHTGALAARDAVVDALFHQAGVIRTGTLEELFDVAAVLANQPLPAGRRVGILTNAGGPGILAADACEAQGLELPALSEDTCATLRSFLPAAASVGNPVDMIASASAAQYERALAAMLADDRVDAVLVIFIPPLVTKGEDVAAAIRRVAGASPAKPVLAIFMSTAAAAPLLAPVPWFRFPESAAVALARATRRGEWLRRSEGTVPTFADVSDETIRAVIDPAVARGGGWLTADECTRLLTASGIPTVTTVSVASADDAIRAADRIGYPVALKASGPEIVHKSERRALCLNLTGADAVRDAWRDLSQRLGAAMTGAIVQPMVTDGIEMLVGMVHDPTFGPVLACATGGTLAELIADAQVRLSPLTDLDAAEMIAGLRGAALLRGYRGRPAADENSLREVLLRLSAVVDRCLEIQELDINPLVVQSHGARALDVRIRVDRPPAVGAGRHVTY
jgi:acetyl coenzyme A synthetase (ADP forming)-like protein